MVHEAKLGLRRPGPGPSLAPPQSIHGWTQERTEASEDSEKGATTAKLTEAARIPDVEQDGGKRPSTGQHNRMPGVEVEGWAPPSPAMSRAAVLREGG